MSSAVFGRAMLEAFVTGTTDPARLADLARGKLRRKLPALREALAGRFSSHHAFLVTQLLGHVDYLDELIETVSGQVEQVIAPFADEVARLDPIPGVNKRTAEVIIAELPQRWSCRELGRPMSRQQRKRRKAPVG